MCVSFAHDHVPQDPCLQETPSWDSHPRRPCAQQPIATGWDVLVYGLNGQTVGDGHLVRVGCADTVHDLKMKICRLSATEGGLQGLDDPQGFRLFHGSAELRENEWSMSWWRRDVHNLDQYDFGARVDDASAFPVTLSLLRRSKPVEKLLKLIRSNRRFPLTVEPCARMEDKDIMLTVAAIDGEELRWAPRELCADRDIVLAAVCSSGLALRFASSDLRADPGVVSAAVQQNREALRFAHPAVLTRQLFSSDSLPGGIVWLIGSAARQTSHFTASSSDSNSSTHVQQAIEFVS